MDIFEETETRLTKFSHLGDCHQLVQFGQFFSITWRLITSFHSLTYIHTTCRQTDVLSQYIIKSLCNVVCYITKLVAAAHTKSAVITRFLQAFIYNL
jgi:hypothetical protein